MSVATVSAPFDEMLEGGRPRSTHRALFNTLEELGPQGLAERARQRDSYLDRHGITFTLGERERPLPMDLVPRIITPTEWQSIEAGVIQRLRTLELFLADVYGEGQVLHDHVIPRTLVTSSTHFHRQAWGVKPANNVRIHVSGIDAPWRTCCQRSSPSIECARSTSTPNACWRHCARQHTRM